MQLTGSASLQSPLRVLIAFLAASCNPQLCSKPQYSGCGKKRSGSVVTFCTAGEAGHLHTLNFHFGRNCGLENSLSIKLCCLEGAETQVKLMNTIPLCLFSSSNFGHFCFKDMLELFHWTPRLPQRNYLLLVVVKISVLEGKEVENSYYTILMMLFTPLFSLNDNFKGTEFWIDHFVSPAGR